MSSREIEKARMEVALGEIAGFQRSRPTGAAGSYQRGYDVGFNNAGLVAAGIAQAALSSEVQPVGSERSDEGNLPPDEPILPLPHPDTSRHVDGAGWETIDSAPRDGTPILTYDVRKSPLAAINVCWWAIYYRDEEGWLDDHDGEPDPTHWRPLPEPPAALAQPDPLTETSGRVDGGDRG